MKFATPLLLFLAFISFSTLGQEIGMPTQIVVSARNGDGMSGEELKALYDECMTTEGWWQGLPPVSDRRFRYTRWEWFRQKPTIPYYEGGGVAFVQFASGAWLGDKFICVAPPDSMMVYS